MKHIFLQYNYLSMGRAALACLFFTLLPGCDGFVETELPNSQLTSATVFEDKATANAAMTYIYSNMRDSGLLTGMATGMGSRLGHYADELDYYSNVPNFLSDYTNSLTAGSSSVAEVWNASYNQIYACNAVIEGVAASVALAADDRRQLRGEALLTRALLHFYLAGIYGPVPYVTGTDYRQNSIVTRLPVYDVYERVIADLEEASDLLPAAYVSTERVRPNKYTAYALLARVNLYQGNWSQAHIMAAAVINQNSMYGIVADLNGVFLKESTSTIWQFMPAIAGKNTDEALSYIFITGPPPNTALTDALVGAFDVADGRRSSWIGEVTDGSTTWYYAYKYKADGNVFSSVEYSILLRLEEMYLIRAEASASLGLIAEAQADLNVIRNRAGLPNTTAATAEALDEAILAERRLEFFTEYGHRFFDLKRSGTLDTVLGDLKPGWNTSDRLWPLPQTELVANPNLRPQNAGY